MLTIRDHHTRDLFDPWAHLGEKRRRLLDRSWAAAFREHLLAHLPVAELAARFSRRLGRPTKDLHAAVGALILQQLHDTTDEDTVEAVALNLAWQYALDIRAESDAYLCERTLRNYRALIIEQGLDQLLFRSLTDRLIRAVGADTSKQRLDSTAIRSAMRTLTRLGTVVEAINKFLRELRRRHADLHAGVDPELIRKYVEREGTGCFASATPSEPRRRLPEAAADLLRLVTRFEGTAAAGTESYRILARVLGEQCEVVGPDADTPLRVKEPAEIPCNNVLNPADPDASYNKHKGDGYLVQVMETYSTDEAPRLDGRAPGPDLITHVAVGKLNTHDSSALDDAQGRGIKPEVVLADTHYGSNENLRVASGRGVEVVAPAMTAKGSKAGRLTLERFDLDEDGRIVRCPGGHAPISTSGGADKIQALFDATTCSACPLLAVCPASAVGRREARYQYTPDRVRQRERRLRDRTAAFRERYRWRSGIEGTMSRLKHRMGLASLRVRGLAAVRYRTFLRALGLNIHRVAAWRVAA